MTAVASNDDLPDRVPELNLQPVVFRRFEGS